MPKRRRLQHAWKNLLTIVALAASLMALYLQIFERRARQEEARLTAVRLDDALAGSRTRLRAEILAALRAELSEESPPTNPGREPLPDTVLRRLEAGGTGGGALEQALGPTASREALLGRFNGALESLARQMEEADRTLRRDLEELRAATLREADVASKSLALVLVALVCLVGRALPELWPRGEALQEEGGSDLPLRASSGPRRPESGPTEAPPLSEGRERA